MYEKSKAPLYFYPRPPGGGRRTIKANCPGDDEISIHALRVEGDLSTVSSVQVDVQFLSTPSGWRATFNSFDMFLL